MRIYIGTEQAAKSNWRELLGDPKKPANWKDETYQAKKPELELKQMAEAPSSLVGGYCPRIALLVEKSPAVVDSIVILTTAMAGVQVTEGPKALLFTCDQTSVIGVLNRLTDAAKGEAITVIGINTLDILRQIAWCAKDARITPPCWLWNAGGVYDTATVVNLYSCSGAKSDTDLTPQQFMDMWTDEDTINGMRTAMGLTNALPAQLQALTVGLIAARMGL